MVFGVVGSAGAAAFTYTNDTDMNIRNCRYTNSDIVISGATGTITDLNLNIEIDHTYLADLDIHLDHWFDGQIWSWVMSDDGSHWNNMNVTFDDEVATSIVGYDPGANDLTGTFRPQSSLSIYDGFSLNGTWRLSVYDDAYGDTGVLRSWSLLGEDSNIDAVPEPATMLLFGLGLLGLAGVSRKKIK